jgi:hypothetical protein
MGADLELIYREMPASYEIIDTADWHIGVANCNESGIFEMIEYVASAPNRYIIVKGDIVDAIPVTDKRFALCSFNNNQVTTPQQQAERVVEILRPIKDRILFLELGNHEYKLINVYDMLRYWCKELETPWGGVMAKFCHTYRNVPQWKGLYHHGNGSFRSQAKDPIQAEANVKALLKVRNQRLASDCIYHSQGHAHTGILVEPTIQRALHMIDNGTALKQAYRVDVNQSAKHIDPEARWYVCNPSFLCTMSQPGTGIIPYSEMAAYSPVEMGYIKQTIEDHKLVKGEKVVV